MGLVVLATVQGMVAAAAGGNDLQVGELAIIVGKAVLFGVGVRDPASDRLAIGVGMIPRGEVGLIVADAGRRMTLDGHPVIDDAIFSAVVLVVLVTTLIAPPLVKKTLQRQQEKTPCPIHP